MTFAQARAEIERMFDGRAREYRETVEPGMSDNSWLEAQLEVLHDVTMILKEVTECSSCITDVAGPQAKS